MPRNKENLSKWRKEWRRNNPQEDKLKQRQAHLRRSFGITIEQYNDLFRQQNGVCAICRKPETVRNAKYGPGILKVDHCHKSGRVRGLLCNRCNLGIGHLQDDAVLVRAAAEYLEKYS